MRTSDMCTKELQAPRTRKVTEMPGSPPRFDSNVSSLPPADHTNVLFKGKEEQNRGW